MRAGTLRRRLMAELGRGFPTRRRLARCGRLVQAALEPPPAAEPPHPDVFISEPSIEAPEMNMPACPTCASTDLYVSRARPGASRCRQCGTEITGDTPA